MLSPNLLARKGAARPAMRSQLALAMEAAMPAPDAEPHTDAALNASALEDLGWNDMGEAPPRQVARVVNFPGDAAARAAEPPRTKRRPRGTALKHGRKAAFTLRIDAERHQRLRLACAEGALSAQKLVTDALDRLFAALAENDISAPDAGAAPAPRKS
jgi:hypothetical protein